MTTTANFRQVAQYIGLAVCGLIVRTAFGMFGILLGIISEIVNGLFRVADRYNRGYPFHHCLLRSYPLVIHPLILTDMAKRNSKKQHSSADTMRWTTSSSIWWKHTSTAIYLCSVNSTTN